MPLRPGDEVRSGRVFRRIQPLRSRFGRGRPKLGAFKADPADGGKLSTTLEALAAEERVLEVALAIVDPKGTFGLCSISIDSVLAATGNSVCFIYDPDPKDSALGDAHVVVPNCDDPAIQEILLRHAKVVRAPEGPEIH